MRALRLLAEFWRVSLQGELAYSANFFIQLLYSVLQLTVGVLSLVVVFSQIDALNGWDYASALTLLGVYLLLGALRGLVIGPSFEALIGLEGEVLSGRFDFTLMRPVNLQWLVSFRRWRPFALLDVALALGVLVTALVQFEQAVTLGQAAAFVLTLAASLAILYAMLLAATALVFWAPGFLYTWFFDGIFQLARYPLGVYPGWLRLMLTWVIPVGLMTGVPAQALSGDLPPGLLFGSLALAAGLLVGASALFRVGLRRYASASS